MPRFSKLMLVLAMGLSPVAAQAQVLYGSLVGNITDPHKGAVADATIQVTDVLTGVRHETHSESQGEYRLDNLQSGTYEVQCSVSGFRAFRRGGIVVSANETARVDISLELGESSQSVVVTAESPSLQTDRSDVHLDISNKELNDLPVGLMELVPGVTPPSNSNSIAGNPAGSMVTNVNGTSYNNNTTRVDGASNSYLWLPHPTAYVSPLESFASVNIVTNNYDAEQGFASGAVVSVGTKSGTNQLHGSAFEYSTNSRLAAHTVFDHTAGLPKNILNQYGGTLGGPILHDRIFFFGSFEGMQERIDLCAS
jgi:hypothetical protein